MILGKDFGRGVFATDAKTGKELNNKEGTKPIPLGYFVVQNPRALEKSDAANVI